MTSEQIAQMGGLYQGQAMNQMAYAGMIGSPRPYGAESLVNQGVNIGGAVAGPGAMVGTALMGLDPFSMAYRGQGMGGGLGMLGRVGGGFLGGAIGGAGFMAATYGAEQAFGGMQQQQALNAMLQQNFQFRNQYGGTGFTRGGMGDIGRQMRGMTEQMGPGGEMIGFEELGRLAQNMARMGMAQGVRDAKDFTDKFKQMVSTLKDIAVEMGTSLEEAQKMMGAMRQAGIFNPGQAAGLARTMRLGAAAGGVATSEISGAGMVGSQISRMVGGRGRAGAVGGMESLINIGVAQQMGITTEEDIYNATGLTGAEGRRAFMQSQMMQSARFLRGGRGRRFLASMAGAGGTLDEEDVDMWMNRGAVSTGETMRRAHENLRGVGRADFIRNEGRLRGEVLQRFGHLTEAIAHMRWAQTRGIDLDSDRGRLWFQRATGTGRDEADALVEQVRNLPQVMERRRDVAEEEEFARGHELRRRGRGIEGVKRKFEQARTEVNNVIRQAAVDWQEELTDDVEGFINRMTGDFIETYRRDVAGAFRGGVRGGGLTGGQEFQLTFGRIGGGVEAMALTGGLRVMDPAARARGLAMRGAGGGAAIAPVSKELAGLLATGFQSGAISGEGAEALGSMRRFLSQLGTGEARALAGRMAGADAASVYGGLARQVGHQVGEREAGLAADPLTSRGPLGGMFRTVGERERAIASTAFGGQAAAAEQARDEGRLARAGAAFFAGAGGMGVLGAAVELADVGPSGLWARLTGQMGEAAQAQAGARFLETTEGTRMLRGAAFGRADMTAQAVMEMGKITKAATGRDLNTSEAGRMQGLQSIAMVGAVAEANRMGLKGPARTAYLQKQALAANVEGVNGGPPTAEEIEQAAAGALSYAAGKGQEAVQQLLMQQRGPAGEILGDLRGVGEGGKATISGAGANISLASDFGGTLSPAGERAVLSFARSKEALATGADLADVETARVAGEAAMTELHGMDPRELEQFIKATRGRRGLGELRRAAGRFVGIETGVAESRRRRGDVGGLQTVTGMLGIGMGRKDIRQLIRAEGGDVGGIAAALGERMGLGEDAGVMQALEQAVGGAMGREGFDVSRGIAGVMADPEVQKQQVAKKRQEDPIQSKIEENTKKMTDLLEQSIKVQRQGNASLLDKLPFIGGDKPEDKGSGGARAA